MTSWIPRQRDYSDELDSSSLTKLVADSHPLATSYGLSANSPSVSRAEAAKPTSASERQPAIFDDPLQSIDDPLSAAFVPSSGGGGGGGGGGDAAVVEDPLVGNGDLVTSNTESPIAASWIALRNQVLKEFTVSGSIRVTASYIDDALDDVSPEDAEPLELEKAKQRIRELESRKAGTMSTEMTQQEYVRRLERIHRDMMSYWKHGRRVMTLKLAIQSAKMLMETDVPQFYPSKFMLVTKLLDTFGDLVFDRIHAIASRQYGKMVGKSVKLPEDWVPTDISAEAKETCRNWVYKTTCIRELLPRLYVEMSILHCFRFISEVEYKRIVLRIVQSIRGIGDPMIANYARTYLLHRSLRVLNGRPGRESLHVGVQDYFATFEQMMSQHRMAPLETMGITREAYLRLQAPGVGFQMQHYGQHATLEEFRTILGLYRDHCGNSATLYHILESFPGRFYSAHTSAMVTLIQQARPSHISQAELFRCLGAGLLDSPPPVPQRLPLLNEAWKVFRAQKDPVLYTSCVAAYVELLVKHYSDQEVMILLRDLSRQLRRVIQESSAVVSSSKPGELPAAVMTHLEKTMVALASVVTAGECSASLDFNAIITSDAFLKLLDMFHSNRKTIVCQTFLEALIERKEPIADPEVIHTMMEIGRHLHDDLDSLTANDRRRQIGELIAKAVGLIDMGRDLERCLHVYVECRSTFRNLEPVVRRVVISVLNLTMQALRLAKGQHNKKSAAFVKSCYAFCHVTIPSIDNIFDRMHLLRVAGMAALANQCLPQADTFFKAAIHEVQDVPPVIVDPVTTGRTDSEPRLVEFLLSMMSSIIPVPGHPEQGPFYLVRGMLTVVQRHKWGEHSGSLARLLIALIPVLAAFAQTSLPLHIENVASNDVLYAGDPTYIDTLCDMLREVVDACVTELAALREQAKTNASLKSLHTTLLLQFAEQLVNTMNLDEEGSKLILSCCKAAVKQDPNSVRLVRLVRMIRRRAAVAEQAMENDRQAGLKSRVTASGPLRWAYLMPLAHAVGQVSSLKDVVQQAEASRADQD